MYAVIKKAKKNLTAKYILPSNNDAVELKGLDNSDWVLQEWAPELCGADVLNEILENAPDSRFFDAPDTKEIDGKLVEGVNDFIDKNFKKFDIDGSEIIPKGKK